MKNTTAVSEHDIRLFFDAADRLLQAAKHQGTTAERATSALLKVTATHERQMRDVREEVITAVASMAGTTAQESARLLANHFREADRAAEKAADRYERACQSLGWRNWIWFLAAQGVMCLMAVVLIITLVPSMDEINARRNTLRQLQAEVQGYPLLWGNCRVKGEVRRCFRLDNRAGILKSDDGSNWYLPWREK